MVSDASDQITSLFTSDENPFIQEQSQTVNPSEYGFLPDNKMDSVPAYVPDEIVNPFSPTFDLTTDDGIRNAANSNPNLKGYLERMRLDGVNQGRQAYAKELTREQGSDQRVEMLTQALFDRYGIEVDEDDANFVKSITKSNAEYNRIEQSKKYLDAAADFFQLPDQDRQTLNAHVSRIEHDPDQMQALAAEMMRSVYEKGSSDTFSGLTPEMLQNHPAMSQSVANEARRQIIAEDNAQRVESGIRRGAPSIPSGGVSASGINALEIAQMEPATRDRFFDALTESQQDEVMTAMYVAKQRGQ